MFFFFFINKHERKQRRQLSDDEALESFRSVSRGPREQSARRRRRYWSRSHGRSRSSSYEHRRWHRPSLHLGERCSRRLDSRIARETSPLPEHVSTSNVLNSDTQAIFTTLVEDLTNSPPQGNKFQMLGNVIPDFDPMVKSQTILM